MNNLLKSTIIAFILLFPIIALSAEIQARVQLESGEPVVGATLWIQKFKKNPKFPGEATCAGIAVSDKDGKFSLDFDSGEYAVVLVRDRCSWYGTKKGIEVTKSDQVLELELVAREEVCTPSNRPSDK